MTRITAHALGTDRLVVCGDDGRRWILTAPAAAVHTDAVSAALDEIRASGPDVDIPVGQRHVEVDSTVTLRDLASTYEVRSIVLWRYAGQPHRILLDPLNAPVTVDLVERLLRAGVREPAVAVALTKTPLISDSLSLLPGDDRDAGVDVLERWEGDAWVPHRLRPAPSVDPLTGILRRIVPRPAEPWHPPGFQHLHAELPHLASVDPCFQPDALAPAGAFTGGPDTPERAAVLSGIAHYCGAYLGQGEIRRATADELRAGGQRVLTVAEWRPHDPTLHTMPGFPFVPDDDHTVTWWLAGDEDGETCWVPFALVHAGYLASVLRPLPPTNSHNLVGLQAGTDLADAADNAAAHIIAHDAVARWWRNPHALPACDPPLTLRTPASKTSIEIRVLAVPSVTAVPVRLVVVDDRADDIIGLGFAAAASPEDAAAKAAAEALIQYASAVDLNSPHSLIRNAESIGNGGVAGLAAFDLHRRYDKTAFADVRRLTDPMCHVQYGLSASSVVRVRQRTAPQGSADPPTGDARPLASLLVSDSRVVVVDVTTPRVREAGFAACRILAPRYERLTPAAFPSIDDQTPPYPGW